MNRVVSSANLQFVDRSIVNARFTLDRDLGIQLRNESSIGKAVFRQIASVSIGEGRNITAPNIGGYDYTVRLEYLPMGKFEGKGDYKMSDLMREIKPKLAIGATFDYNVGASRQRGQLGLFMIDSTGYMYKNDLRSIYLDAILKYNGWSFMTEYSRRRAKEQVIASTTSGDLKYGTGDGVFSSAAYLFENNFELAVRYSYIVPDDPTYSSIPEQHEYLFGISKYFVGHSLKFQSDVFFRDHKTAQSDFWGFRAQVEFSILIGDARSFWSPGIQLNRAFASLLPLTVIHI